MNKMKKLCVILLTIITISIVSFNIFADTTELIIDNSIIDNVQIIYDNIQTNTTKIGTGVVYILDSNDNIVKQVASSDLSLRCIYVSGDRYQYFSIQSGYLGGYNYKSEYIEFMCGVNAGSTTYNPRIDYHKSTTTNYYLSNGYKYKVEFSSINDIGTQLLNLLGSTSIPTPTITINDNVISWENPGYNVEYSYRSGQTYVGEWSSKGATFGDNKPNNWTINDIGYYRIKFISSDMTASGEWSNVVYYNGENLQHLPTPSVYYDSINNQFTFSNYDNTYAINMYIDGRLNRIYQNANNIQANASGNYQFQYSKSGYASSNTNNPINVILPEYEPTVPVAPNVPTEPTTSNIFDWIKYYGDYIGYYIETIVNGILNIFKNAINSISSFGTYINQFISSFGDLFVFLPQELKIIFVSVITIALLFVIIKFIKS